MAAQEFSFDIVSRADKMEVKNGIDQAQRELANRYDFRGSNAEIIEEKEGVTLVAEDEFKMNQLKDIVVSKLLKRGVDIRQIDWGKLEPGAGVSMRQKLILKTGIPQDQAKALIRQIKDKGLKVSAQIQGEEVRVSGKNKDDLQKTIQFVKGLNLSFPVNFVNYR
jgi:uncharacterized protein YajQ (UPF0234 family)